MQMNKCMLFIALFTFAIISCTEQLTEITQAIYVVEDVERVEKSIMTKSSSSSSAVDFGEGDYPYTVEEDSLYIESMGWTISEISDEGDYYVVNNELLFFKTDMITYRDETQTKLYGTPLAEKAQHMILHINYYKSQDELQPFIDAVNEWNSLDGCNIFFDADIQSIDYDKSGWPVINVDVADSNVMTIDYNVLDLGIGITPGTKYGPGHYMLVDTDNEEYLALSYENKKYAIMHALGHLIGLEDAEKSNNLIEGTSNNTNSIMASYSYLQSVNKNWSGFTFDDIKFLSQIYPLRIDEIILNAPEGVTYLSDLKQYMPYIFTSSCRAVKPVTDVEFEYEVVCPEGGFVTKKFINGTTAQITFNTSGLYTVRTIAKSTTSILPETYIDERNFRIIGEIIYCPESLSEVSLNEEFSIYWRCPDATNPSDPESEIEISGYESVFDKNSNNISFRKSNDTTYVTIKDYGKYEITMKAVASDGTILKIYKLNIEKYYRPNYRGMVSYVSDELGFTPPCFSIQGEVCNDDMSKVKLEQTINNAYEILFMVSDKFPQRFCIHRYRKYRRLSGYARRMDVRELVDTTSYTPITFPKGTPPMYYVSVPCLITDSETIGMDPDTYTRYICYYAYIFPKDKIELKIEK